MEENGNGIRRAPRWFLALLATGFVGGAVAWARHVETHIADSNAGYQRIASLEARVANLEAHAAWCRRSHGVRNATEAPY